VTTDELVAKVIEDFLSGMKPEDFNALYAEYLWRVSPGVYSLALNWETRDVRYVRFLDKGDKRFANEVTPRTVMRTQYEKVS
jgi:hypothetical protein